MSEFVRCRFPEGKVAIATEKRYMEIGLGYAGKCSSVLDIGCGWGYGTHILSKFFEKVDGMDIHLPHLDHARENYPGVNFIHADAQCIELKGYDLYVAMEVIETFDNAAHTLKTWVDTLDGILVGYTLDGRKPQPRAEVNPYVKSFLTPEFVRSLEPGLTATGSVRIAYTNPQYFWFEVER